MYNRPSLDQLITRIRADVLGRLGMDEALRRADAEVYSRALAAGIHGLYGYLEFLGQQMLPDTAVDEYLDRHASIWLPVPRKSATAASGTTQFTVASGSSIPAGTVLSSLSGAQYTTTADATITGASATAPIQALLAGVDGNLAIGQSLMLASPIPGVNTAGISATAISGGADRENDTDLRARILARIQDAPHGGAFTDYIGWAKEIPGVTRAWVCPGEMGAGTVTVRFMRDNDANPIPDAAAVATVQNYIAARAPVTAKVYVVAPIAVPLNLTLSVLPNTGAVQAAVTAMLKALIVREATPGGTYWDVPTTALVSGGTLPISHIREAISGASGETDHILSVPSANVVLTTGQITTLGVITWQ